MRKRKAVIDSKLRDKVLSRDRHTCQYCGTREGPFWIDHIYPESKGGETTMNNLVTACKRCNLQKGNKIGVWPVTKPYYIKLPFIFVRVYTLAVFIMVIDMFGRYLNLWQGDWILMYTGIGIVFLCGLCLLTFVYICRKLQVDILVK